MLCEWFTREQTGATKAIEYIKTHKTQSGVDNIFGAKSSTVPPADSQKRKIIEQFTGSPRISEDIQSPVQAEWEPLLRYALVAAVIGCKLYIGYFKNKGRELKEALEVNRMRNSTIYMSS
ncbi:hypothetical protein FOPG_06829 [Fusarium oxysporum f. sp. conglutinans race 2 54008]|uniref:Uncharacterized protein n=2 Tax=Fusarium oxysporum f. sp. conglutinans TaxID=100902 RepID=A0A8H6GZC8_FUSOX|nr:hypothetical protein FOPG_06829 [Fusarium oxysporum f. sp. conglutinans race 2 54008]KAF6526211.1 hypothetical protein HZS61_009255 [Fusarium oxysporum f. sp. conglutinans]KAG6980855.1 hypothetical protein FocnCong_v009191 [Fusarium oxysporum f. sp. conglutinans]KAI8414452.1 hypothetical protein FOFC_04063 [Fusarium oxysporum]